MIDNDLAELKKYLDMINDFPFGGHVIPLEDLKSLATTVLDDSMPPMMYKITHDGSSLNEDKKLKVLAWIYSSKKLLLLNLDGTTLLMIPIVYCGAIWSLYKVMILGG